jgi:hypothetical protein
VHSFPQGNFQIPLAKKSPQAYCHGQIEPGSLKNFAAQLKEGAAAARLLRPQSFSPSFLPQISAALVLAKSLWR